MGKRIAGVCYVKVDGGQISVAGNVTVSIMATEKEGLSGLSGVAGFKETPRVPSIEVEAHHVPEFDMASLEAMTDGTITAELANGKTAVLSGAWLAGTVDFSASDGTGTLKFEGLEGKWI